jgi:hypothetical protein
MGSGDRRGARPLQNHDEEIKMKRYLFDRSSRVPDLGPSLQHPIPAFW